MPPVASVQNTDSNGQKGKDYYVDKVYLTDLPRAMDKMGWKVSAAMMRRWFSNPVFVMQPENKGKNAPDPRTLPAAKIDDQIIKMKWLLGFKRIQPIFEELHLNWANKAGFGLLRDRLKKQGWLNKGKIVRLGYGLNTAKELDRVCHVNTRLIGKKTDTLDDLFGAVYNANFKVAVVGTAYYSPEAGRNIFEVDKLGFYISDVYDFSAEWYEDAFMGLGVWSKDRCLTKAEMLEYKASPFDVIAVRFPNFVPVRNSDFRKWQYEKKTGGDFYVYSDVYWVRPHAKDKIIIL